MLSSDLLFGPSSVDAFTGREVVEEYIRQKCLYIHHPSIWWRYIADDSAIFNAGSMREQSYLLMSQHGANPKTIHECESTSVLAEDR